MTTSPYFLLNPYLMKAKQSVPDVDLEQKLNEINKIYPELKKNYTCAIRQVRTKLQNLDDDFQLRHMHNPIHHMDSRIKTADSILEKLVRRGFSLDIDKIGDQLTDIAGIRVICPYIEDIYTIAKLLKNQSDVTLLRESDYIKNPKENGYRSLHLIVSVPIYLVDACVKLPVEIQIRTIAMDFWASLEHKLRYKTESNGELPKFIADQLKECADNITNSDMQMQKIHSFLEDLDKISQPQCQI